MKTVKVVEVTICKCDKCKKEIVNGAEIRLTRKMIGFSDAEFDICSDCYDLFRKFMHNRLDEEVKEDISEEEKTEEQVEPVVEETEEVENVDIIHFYDDDADVWPSSLPKRLIAFRKAKGLNQQEMAALIGVGQSTLSRWENGENWHINSRTSFKLEKFLKENASA